MSELLPHATFTPITALRLDWTDFIDIISSPVRRRDLATADGALVVVAGSDDPTIIAGDLVHELVGELAGLPVVVAVDHDLSALGSAAALADVVAQGDDLDAVVDGFDSNPLAATALAILLRGSERRSVGEGLAAESAVYSALQVGPEFERWRRSRPARDRPEPDRPAVRIERVGDTLEFTLDRAQARNALDAHMRDGLWDALILALAEPELAIRWRAEGPSFCSGGDLDEFGTRPDPATGHVVRLARSLGSALAEMADRVTVEVHGACFGSGIELPAFAGRIVAAPDTTIALPELALGLIPGAGGTWSMPRRIGRHRTAWLALTGRPIAVDTARAWGLVDEVDDQDQVTARLRP